MTDQVSVDPAGPDEQPRVWLDGKVVIVAGCEDVIRFGSANVGDEVRNQYPDAVELRPVSPSPATTEAESRGARRSGHPCPTFGGGCYDPEHCMQGGRCEDAKRFFAVPAAAPADEDVRTEWGVHWSDSSGWATTDREAQARAWARTVSNPGARVARRTVQTGPWVAADEEEQP